MPSPLPIADPSDAVRVARARETAIRSLRAVFSSTTRGADGERSADGVLLVRKPHDFRLRLFLPIGLTVLDYVYRDGETRLSTPLARNEDLPRDITVFSMDELGRAFLRRPLAVDASCATTPGAPNRIVCDDGESVRRRTTIDGGLGVVVEESFSEPGSRPRMILRFGDYRIVNKDVLPFAVRVSLPVDGVEVEILVRRYEVNPRLPDGLFAVGGS